MLSQSLGVPGVIFALCMHERQRVMLLTLCGLLSPRHRAVHIMPFTVVLVSRISPRSALGLRLQPRLLWRFDVYGVPGGVTSSSWQHRKL